MGLWELGLAHAWDFGFWKMRNQTGRWLLLALRVVRFIKSVRLVGPVESPVISIFRVATYSGRKLPDSSCSFFFWKEERKEGE